MFCLEEHRARGAGGERAAGGGALAPVRRRCDAKRRQRRGRGGGWRGGEERGGRAFRQKLKERSASRWTSDRTMGNRVRPASASCWSRDSGRHVGMWGYGATAARLTPDQKVASSNLSAVSLTLVPHWPWGGGGTAHAAALKQRAAPRAHHRPRKILPPRLQTLSPTPSTGDTLFEISRHACDPAPSMRCPRFFHCRRQTIFAQTTHYYKSSQGMCNHRQ